MKKLRKIPKRILSFVLTLAMVFTLMPGMSVEVKAEGHPTCYCTDSGHFMHLYIDDIDTDGKVIAYSYYGSSFMGGPAKIDDFGGTTAEKGKWYYTTTSSFRAMSPCDTAAGSGTPAHTHDWKYSVTGNKLEAYCANEGCDNYETSYEDAKANNKLVSLTLTATSSNYSGIDGLAEFNTATERTGDDVISESDVKFYKVETEGATTGGTLVTETPTEAGYYYASLTVEDATAVKAFTINEIPKISAQNFTLTKTATGYKVTANAVDTGDYDTYWVVWWGTVNTFYGMNAWDILANDLETFIGNTVGEVFSDESGTERTTRLGSAESSPMVGFSYDTYNTDALSATYEGESELYWVAVFKVFEGTIEGDSYPDVLYAMGGTNDIPTEINQSTGNIMGDGDGTPESPTHSPAPGPDNSNDNRSPSDETPAPEPVVPTRTYNSIENTDSSNSSEAWNKPYMVDETGSHGNLGNHYDATQPHNADSVSISGWDQIKADIVTMDDKKIASEGYTIEMNGATRVDNETLAILNTKNVKAATLKLENKVSMILPTNLKTMSEEITNEKGEKVNFYLDVTCNTTNDVKKNVIDTQFIPTDVIKAANGNDDSRMVVVRTNNKDYENITYIRLDQMDLTKKKVSVYLYAPASKKIIPYMAGTYLNGVIDIPVSAANFIALVVEE